MTRTWLFSISQCCDLTAILGSFSYVQKVTTSSFPGSLLLALTSRKVKSPLLKQLIPAVDVLELNPLV